MFEWYQYCDSGHKVSSLTLFSSASIGTRRKILIYWSFYNIFARTFLAIKSKQHCEHLNDVNAFHLVISVSKRQHHLLWNLLITFEYENANDFNSDYDLNFISHNSLCLIVISVNWLKLDAECYIFWENPGEEACRV